MLCLIVGRDVGDTNMKPSRNVYLASALLLTSVGSVSAIDATPQVQTEMIALGRDLFFDPILSGNKNISCATCHHPEFGTSDGLSLGIGEGGTGLGPDRTELAASAPKERVPRNAPALFNLGLAEFTTLLHDGRVAADPNAPFGFAMPKGQELERPVSGALAAQAHLPVTSATEMAGQPGENDVADAVAEGRILGPGGARD